MGNIFKHNQEKSVDNLMSPANLHEVGNVLKTRRRKKCQQCHVPSKPTNILNRGKEKSVDNLMSPANLHEVGNVAGKKVLRV